MIQKRYYFPSEVEYRRHYGRPGLKGGGRYLLALLGPKVVLNGLVSKSGPKWVPKGSLYLGP